MEVVQACKVQLSLRLRLKNILNKPITLIVPLSVGTAADLIARVLEKSALKYLGQPLTIVNKPGGTGTIGWNELASSNPDGYTIGHLRLLNYFYNPFLYLRNMITQLR